ncbi:hypothetical protein SO802_009905 [Lithocarpus litseifolius]|uniref:RNase H type-1 domain-containing protein n=1 Tax=Lithocarpus litseifolius TaxID=425828 RepID=A0AAW2DCS0_9ROSI
MKTRVKPTRTARVKWKPLDRISYKTNFDGAMFHNSGEAALGVVVQNHEGEVMAALSKKIPLPPSVTQLELLATRQATLFVQEDTMVYVNSLQSFSFSQIYRQGNSVADALAKKARFGSSLTIWMEFVPPDICTLISADKPFLD